MQVQLEKIPQFLKTHGQFCCWQYELRDGNKTKVPYTPGTARRANVKIPATFTAFETAASATGYDGIGIRVCGRIVGIDLDHCMEDGKLLPWAQTIVDRFGATYIEVSPSGTGIRIFCLLPDGFIYDTQTYYIKKGDIEVYISGHTNRFLTITGNALTENDVVETAESLLWLLDTYMRRPTPPTPAVAAPGVSYLSDDEVIAKASAAKNGEKFRRLWNGDITGYKSQSEADAALVSILAFWCSGDKAQMKYASRWQSHSNRVNILKDAQVYHPIPYGSFDADIYIFNCKNGTLHIDTGEFTEHRSTDLLTKISPVVYDPTAYSERFATYIDEIMSGDTERAKFLQKILGYGLTGDTRHECMTILYGVTTRNGKGTLCESVLKVLGDYGCASRPETIAMKSYTNSSQPSEDVARLAGVRFVNIPEPGKGMVLDAAKVKAMTGNDTLNARFLHENSFDFQPQFKIYVNTNFLPVINDMTLFSSDRIIIIPFDRHFDEQSRDTTLKCRFAEEGVQSAILNWLLEGYRLLQTEGLFLPKSVKDATDRYQHDSDKMALFFEDNLVADETAEELTSTVYARYKGWCQENGCYPESMKNFKQGLQAFAQVVRKRPKYGGEKTTMLIGYRLISEFDAPPLT